MDEAELVYRDDEPEVPDRLNYFRIVPRGGATVPVTIDGSEERIFEEISKIDSSAVERWLSYVTPMAFPRKEMISHLMTLEKNKLS